MTPVASITVTHRKTGITLLTCGQRDINWCRARITQHGYHLTLTATMNYGAIATGDISALEQAMLGAITDMFTHATELRAANHPLFDLTQSQPAHQEGDPS